MPYFASDVIDLYQKNARADLVHTPSALEKYRTHLPSLWRTQVTGRQHHDERGTAGHGLLHALCDGHILWVCLRVTCLRGRRAAPAYAARYPIVALVKKILV